MAESSMNGLTVLRGNKFGFPCTYVRFPSGQWVASCSLPKPDGGKLRIMATADEKEILTTLFKLIRAKAKQRGMSDAQVAGLFSKIKKGFKKIGKGIKKGVKGIGKIAHKIVDNKLVRGLGKIAKVIPIYGPMINKGLKAARGVTSIVKNLGGGGGKKGKQKAKKQVVQLKKLAKKGDKRAARALFAIRRQYRDFTGIRPVRGRLRGGYGTYRDPRTWQRRFRRGYGRAYSQGISSVGAWDGAKWLWDELRPHSGISQSTLTRQGYRYGLAEMSARA